MESSKHREYDKAFGEQFIDPYFVPEYVHDFLELKDISPEKVATTLVSDCLYQNDKSQWVLYGTALEEPELKEGQDLGMFFDILEAKQGLLKAAKSGDSEDICDHALNYAGALLANDPYYWSQDSAESLALQKLSEGWII